MSSLKLRRASIFALAICMLLPSAEGNPTGGTTRQSEDAVALTAEAIRLHAAGRDREALPLAERALHLREATLGPEHPEVATGLSNLAVLYLALGRPADGIAASERALQIWERALGPDHPNIAVALINLAGLLTVVDQYDRPVALLERALRIRETTLGPAHPDVAQVLSNLAEVLRVLGQYDRASPLQERALHIREAALGPTHPDVAQSLNSLGNILRAAGRREEALEKLERALQIREAARGPRHPDVAVSLVSTAGLLFDLGRTDEAAARYERALHIREALVGPDHPDVAVCLTGLGDAAHAVGHYPEALTFFERALRIWEATLGPDHPNVGLGLANLGAVYVSMRQRERALPLFERVVRIHASEIQRTAAYLTGEELRGFLTRMQGGLGYLMTLALDGSDDRRVRTLALRAALLLKARGEDESIATVAAVRRSRDPRDRTLVAEWVATRSRSVSLPAGGATLSERSRLEDAARVIEEQLSRRSAALHERFELTQTGTLLGRVAHALASDAALVELVAFRPVNLFPARSALREMPIRYAAFVLHADGTHAVADLGEATPIDALARSLTIAVTSPQRAPDAIVDACRALNRRLFAPIVPLLHADVRRLVLAPDGPLNLAPLHLMHDGHAWLLDRYVVSYVTSGRDLLRERHTQDTPSMSTAIIATRYPVPEWNLPALTTQATLLPRLVPGIRLLRDASATEAALRDVSAPLVLHVGVHGQFLEDTSAGASRTAMQRGRLVMADADPSQAYDRSHSDGYATAAELLSSNLRGTRLVVLSACDTALGGAEVGGGVVGLRRAFLLAGAEALVTTQWSIDQRAGTLFTVALYEGLRRGMRSADAVTRAMRVVRERDPAPYAWAPFVLVGRDDVIDWNAAPTATAAVPHATTSATRAPVASPDETPACPLSAMNLSASRGVTNTQRQN